MGYTGSQPLSFHDRYDYEPVQISDFASINNSNLGRAIDSIGILSDVTNDVIINHPHNHIRKSSFENRYSKPLFMIAFLLGLLTGYDLTIGKSKDKIKIEEKVIELTRPTQRTPMELLGSLARITTKLWETTFQEDFGPYRSLMLDKTLLYRIFKCSDASREKLVRRLMLKLVEAQMLGTSKQATFTWVTAGDSTAAAHGNMYSQSYTATLEQIAKVAFDGVGINFVARNHAMADVGSPELSLCMESVYGSQIDMLMWDFSRAERLSDYRVELFGNRAAVHPTAPVIMVMDSSVGDHWSRFYTLEGLGLSAILMDEAVMSHVLNGRLPGASSTYVASEDASEAIQNFLCNGDIEGLIQCDDPLQNFVCDSEGGEACRAQKYNVHKWCPGEVRYQKSFNPGWKKHFFLGRFLALYLIETLNHALLALDKLEGKSLAKDRLQEIYESLKTQEDYDVNEFLRNPAAIKPLDRPNDDHMYSPDSYKIYREHVICRTALLPSQVAIMAGLREEVVSADLEFKSKNTPVLTFDPAERQQCEGLNFDYKDYFAIRKHDGGVSLKIPNDAEKHAFPGKGNFTNSALIMLCQRKCVNNLCSSNIVGLEEITADQNNFSMLVNEQPVVKAVPFEDCHLLANDAGLEWEGGVEGVGRFTLRFMLPEANRELQISSVIVIY